MRDQPTWTAKITREQMAVELCNDLAKKFKILQTWDESKVTLAIEGIVDGLRGSSIPHPTEPTLPNFLKSMDPVYVAGFEVGETWARIAKEWGK